jgi:hypothetical protein
MAPDSKLALDAPEDRKDNLQLGVVDARELKGLTAITGPAIGRGGGRPGRLFTRARRCTVLGRRRCTNRAQVAHDDFVEDRD